MYRFLFSLLLCLSIASKRVKRRKLSHGGTETCLLIWTENFPFNNQNRCNFHPNEDGCCSGFLCRGENSLCEVNFHCDFSTTTVVPATHYPERALPWTSLCSQTDGSAWRFRSADAPYRPQSRNDTKGMSVLAG